MASNKESDPVRYLDRESGQVIEEAIYGERWLRWTYGSPLGRLTNALLLRRAFFSVLFGAWMNSRASAGRIPAFIESFGIDMRQFEAPASGKWRSFNEFFARALRPGARPVCEGADAIALPADGRHSAWAGGTDLSCLCVKGRPFTVAELLADAELAQRFAGGALVVSRLCPTDYHRFHFPADGVPGAAWRIRGHLDSVSPIALAAGVRSLCANKRELTLLETPHCGCVALVEVGAACVGRIEQSYKPGKAVHMGDEKGRFLFGGSTVITLFEPGRVTLAEDLTAATAKGMETYAKMGTLLGQSKGPQRA